MVEQESEELLARIKALKITQMVVGRAADR